MLSREAMPGPGVEAQVAALEDAGPGVEAPVWAALEDAIYNCWQRGAKAELGRDG